MAANSRTMKTAHSPHKNETKSEPGVHLRSGIVDRICGSTYFVANSFSLVRADRSLSCLLRPEKGDLVLLSENGMGNASILTVLEREVGSPAMVSVDGDLTVHAAGELSFLVGQGLNLLAPEILFKARLGKMAIKECTYAGALLTTCGRQLRSVFQSVETNAAAMVERVNRLYRRIGDEDARFSRLECRVEHECSIRSRDASIDAAKQMDLRSDKIELG
ncbi:MAG: DUF3540 domain-containing protein [Candidatus Electrothrix sp. AR4]|nr:DUF3540 domain-containing protein [Candidatus Electrothrix sp. AR4]